jgi:hypothetical protein
MRGRIGAGLLLGTLAANELSRHLAHDDGGDDAPSVAPMVVTLARVHAQRAVQRP